MKVIDNNGLLEKVQDILPADKYGAIERIEQEDGTRRAKFVGTWGRNGHSRKVCHKVDKPVEGEHALSLRERGYNTGRDIETLLAWDPIEAGENRVSPLLDFHESEGVAISTEPFYEGAVSLGRYFSDRKPTKKEFESVFRDVITAVRYANDRGVFHRDLNNNGIMVAKENGRLRARVTDWEIAVEADKVKDKPHTTVGSRSLRDPLLDAEGAVYGVQAEMYQIAANALMVLTGEPFENKDKDSVKDALKKVPWGIRRKHGGWIKSCLNYEPQSRPKDLKALGEMFGNASAPGILETLVNNGTTTLAVAGLAATTTFGGFASMGWLDWEKINEGTDEYVANYGYVPESWKYPVIVEWDGLGMEYSNNLVELNMNVTRNADVEGKQKFDENDNVIFAEPGETLWVTVGARELAWPKPERFPGSIGLEGRVYIEGYKDNDGDVAEDLRVVCRSHDQSPRYEGRAQLTDFARVDVPKEPGVYVLAAELYAPDEERAHRNNPLSHFKFSNLGDVLSRERITIVAGDPEQKVALASLNFHEYSLNNGWTTTDYARTQADGNYYGANMDKVDMDMVVPREGVVEDMDWGKISLPRGTDTEPTNAYFTVKDSGGELNYFTAVPVQREFWGTPGDESDASRYHWRPAVPGKDFAEQLLEYRESIESEGNDK